MSDAFDLLPDGVVLADAQGVVVYVNAMAARMVGPSLTPGRPLAEAMALQDHDGHAWFETVDPYGGLGTRTRIPEQTWFAPDDTELLLTVRTHRSSPREPVHTVAVVIRDARGRLRLDRERSDLVATVAHELRSPLSGVKGFVNALLTRWDKLTDDQKKLMLTTVSVDADRLTRLIAELLDVARIDTGRLRLHRRATDVVGRLEHVAETLRQTTAREIAIDVATDVPAVDADPDKLTQVLTNIMENGLRHGEGQVLVRVRKGELDGQPAVVLSISDEGTGIPAEMRTRAFTKFWTAGTGGGSGLGLYIVNGLVSAHGGVVTLGDAPGGGTLVTLTWPSADTRSPETTAAS